MTRKKVESIAKSDDRRDSRDDQVEKAGICYNNGTESRGVECHPMRERPGET